MILGRALRTRHPPTILWAKWQTSSRKTHSSWHLMGWTSSLPVCRWVALPSVPPVSLISRRETFITSPSCMTGARMGIFPHSSQESSMFSQVQVRISPSWQSSVFSDLWAGNISLSQPLDIVLLAGKSSLELMVLIRNVSYCSTSVPINKRVLRKYFEPPSVTKTCHISFNLLPWKLCSHKYNLNRKYVWALQK